VYHLKTDRQGWLGMGARVKRCGEKQKEGCQGLERKRKEERGEERRVYQWGKEGEDVGCAPLPHPRSPLLDRHFFSRTFSLSFFPGTSARLSWTDLSPSRLPITKPGIWLHIIGKRHSKYASGDIGELTWTPLIPWTCCSRTTEFPIFQALLQLQT